MEEDEIIGEFEVSFNYKNVLYVCQVQPAGDPNDPYYKVEYYSPNGKGIITKLSPGSPKPGSNKKYWTTIDGNADPEFVQELGNMIEKNRP